MGETLIPTHGLRLVQSRRSDAVPPILQQRYINPGNGRETWRDVPIIYDDPAAAEIGKSGSAASGQGGES